MQRPTPLPPSPERVAPVVAVAERAPSPLTAGSWGERPARSEAETGPGPSDGVLAGPAVAPAPEAPAADPVPEAPAADPPLGLRDVWRAARARRRALRAEVRRFTVRQRRRRLVWAAAAASVVVLALATLGAAYSPLFAVERVRIVGAQGLDTAAVETALDAQLGTPLPLVDASAVKAALVAFPLVESFSLEARPPHELVVRVVERTPVGVVKGTAGYTLVDAAGVALATTPDAPAGQPLLDVTGEIGGDAFAAVGLVIRSLPTDLRAQVTGASASSADDIVLTLAGVGTQVVWGSAADSGMKAQVLETAIRLHPLGTVSEYDVSSPRALVVR